MTFLLWQFLWLPLGLFMAYPLAIQYEHESLPEWLRRGEWTFSTRLERLCVTPGERQQLFIEIAKEINRASPDGRHIRAVLGM